MRLFRFLDGYFHTSEQRRNWLGLISSLIFLYSSFWTLLLLFRLFSLSDYDQLFALYGTLDVYRASIPARIAMQVMVMPLVSAWALIRVLQSALPWWFVLALVCGLVFMAGSKKRIFCWDWLFAQACGCAFLCVGIVLALKAKSLLQGMEIMRLFSLISAGFVIFACSLQMAFVPFMIRTISCKRMRRLHPDGK